jgi:hypothetical protein
MALVLSDRVQETSTSTGTGTITLAGAVTGYQSFAVVGNTNTTYYTIADQSGSNWEVGIGTYYTGNVSLARTTILASSNANAVVNFGAGTKSVFVTYPAEKAVYLDANNVTTITNFASANVLITGGTISGITIPAANVSGLGTMATQNANAITVTGGTISGTGITSGNVTITGGTINNVSLTNVTYGGLGTMSTQNATTVVITGGTINSVAFTGGTLNNMTIGATTANTGSFTTVTANLATFSGNATSTAFNTVNIVEPTTVSGTGAASTINFDVNTQSVYYSTANATANWTVNFRGSSTFTLANTLANNQTITCSLLATQGATAYYNSLVQIDGSTVTPKWQGGTAPTSGDTAAVDVYNYVITKTSTAPTYTVLASITKFA